MNTHIRRCKITAVHAATTIGALSLAVLTMLPLPVGAVDSFQQRALFSPHKSLLRAEARGRVMIYDGIDSKIVDKAMDEQFDRIDNMMFVRIHHRSVMGDDDYIEDDGCE